MHQTEREKIQYLESTIRTIPDFPKPGIQFKDITPLLANPTAVSITSELLMDPYKDIDVDVVVGLESRGFLFGPRLAMDLNAGFVPIRKPNRLPYKTIRATYQLEYGEDSVEMHEDAIKPGSRVVVHDDLIATGGTAGAATELVKQLGGVVVGYSFIIELSFLNGTAGLTKHAPTHAIITI